jgi:putative N6-adenine-specific DNA methylase
MNQYGFFVSTGLDMEQGTADEIREIWPWLLDLDGRPHAEPLPEFKMQTGGIEFQAPLHLGLELNFLLKTAHRVLLRLAEFKVRDFPKLFQRAQKIPWQDWINDNGIFLEVSASQSRLNNEKRVAETLCDAWKLKPVGKDKAQQRIFVRVHDDQVTVSLDTTGEHLHFRGMKKMIGEAPVRETLAAHCLQRLIGEKCWAELSKVTLIDPMVGSGTFLLEALTMSQPAAREFSFQGWKKCPKALMLPEFQRPWMDNKNFMLWHKLLGFDQDPKMIDIARNNLKFIDPSFQPELGVRDIFSEKASDIPQAGIRWLILNPPYGERIEWKHSPQELLEALEKTFSPDRIGILWSQNQALRAPKRLKTLQQMASYPLQNGGLRVQFQVWNRE